MKRRNLKVVETVAYGMMFFGVLGVALSGDALNLPDVNFLEYLKMVTKVGFPVYLGFGIIMALEIISYLKDRANKTARRRAIVRDCRARLRFEEIVALTNLKED